MDVIPSTTTMQSRSTNTSILAWLAVCLVATSVLTIAAAHAPPRVRLIGLFSIGFGAIIGWLTVVLTGPLEVLVSTSTAGVVAGLLTLGGLIGCTMEIARLDDVQKSSANQEELAMRMLEQMNATSQGGSPPKPATERSSIQKHLNRRLRQLGQWKSPWPEIFWCSELVLAASVSAWVARRSARGREPTAVSRIETL